MDHTELDAALDELHDMLHLPTFTGPFLGSLEAIISGDPASRDIQWRDVWTQAKDIQAGFKGVRYPTASERQAAWERFNNLRDAATAISQKQRESLHYESKRHRERILDLAKDATVPTFEIMPPFNDAERMKERGAVLKEAWTELSEHKHQMTAEHKKECFDRLVEVKAGHDSWWEGRKQHGAEKRESWQERVQANLKKNRELLRERTVLLARMEEQADELRGKIADAWSDEFRERAGGWLSELEGKIDGLKEYIERIESWIDEDEKKLE